MSAVCPDRETLRHYCLGLLSDEQSDELAAHLESCSDCQATIVNLEDATDTLIGRLRTPSGNESCLGEPQFEAAVAKALVMPAPRLPSPEITATLKTLGEYQFLGEIGRGGMGRVYKALHMKLDRIVAVKVLPHARSDDPQAISRFEREMKAVGRLNHPNIVQAYDAREIDGTPVLIMEYVDGLDLAEIVRRVGPLPCSDACELVRQTAEALQCAHEHGLVHRDVKPSNIMLSQSGEVKLLDLGLSRLYADAGTADVATADEMTGTGQAMGTADYMAPEQASDSRSVDIRADLYSLGCTLYKLLCGRVPFGGPDYRGTFDKLNAHAHQTPAPIRQLVPEVPEEVEKILNRLLAKNPEDRFATPAEVAAAVEPFAAEADLIDLIEYAESVPAGSAAVPAEIGGRDARAPEPQPASQRWKSFVKLALLSLLFGGFGYALAIVIQIKQEGKETTITISDDAPSKGKLSVEAKSAERTVVASPAVPKPIPPEGPGVIKSIERAVHLLDTIRRRDPSDTDLSAAAQALTDRINEARACFSGTAAEPQWKDVEAFLRQWQRFIAERRDKEAAFRVSERTLESKFQVLENLVKASAVVAAQTKPVQPPSPSDTRMAASIPDEQAIQGTWEVVGSTFALLQKLPPDVQAEKEIPVQQVLKTTKVIITGDTLKIVGPHVTNLAFEYRLNPEAKTKMIDLQTGGAMGLVSYGIYRLDGDELKICSSGLRVLDVYGFGDPASRPDARNLRPAEFWSEFGSGKEMLVLRRVGPAAVSEDENNIQGTWQVEKATDEGSSPLFGFKQGAKFTFSRRKFTLDIDDQGNPSPFGYYDIGVAYALDPSVAPKRIDVANIVSDSITPIHGIYELQGDRLTINWSVSSPYGGGMSSSQVPTKFSPDKHTQFVVLTRVKPGTAKSPPPGGMNSPASVPVNPSLSWGPWIECELEFTRGGKSIIDFDTRKVFSGLKDVDERNTAELEKAMKSTGGDAIAVIHDQGLRGVQMVVVPVSQEVSERLSVTEVQEKLAAAGVPATPAMMSGKGQLPATYLFKTREGHMGMLSIAGRAENSRNLRIMYMMLHPFGPSSTSTPVPGPSTPVPGPATPPLQNLESPLTFGPIIERTLRNQPRDCAIDFETGTIWSSPYDVTQPGTDKEHEAKRRQLKQWAKEHGVDAIGPIGGAAPILPPEKKTAEKSSNSPKESYETSAGLEGFHLFAAPPKNENEWNTLTPKELDNQLDDLMEETHDGYKVLINAFKGLPSTWLFKTREGGKGILQILDVSQEQGIKIRYKMLQRSGVPVGILPNKTGDDQLKSAKTPPITTVSQWHEKERMLETYIARKDVKNTLDVIDSMLLELQRTRDIGNDSIDIRDAMEQLNRAQQNLKKGDWKELEKLLPRLPETSTSAISMSVSGYASAPKAPTYRTAKITRGDITATINATGTIEPEEVVDVSADVSGKIVGLGEDPRGEKDANYKGKSVDYGTPVEAGTVLARIDDGPYKEKVQQEEANLGRVEVELRAAQAKAVLAETEWKKSVEANKKIPNTIPDMELQKLKTSATVAALAVESAQAALKQGKLALDKAKTNLARAVVKSPINGVIISRRVNVGQNVAPAPNAAGLFLIAKDLKKMQVWAVANEADIGRIHEGMKATFTVDAFPGKVFQGAVSQIRTNAAMTQNIVTYTVVVPFDNPDLKLMPNMTANVRFEIEARRNVLCVPNEALRSKSFSREGNFGVLEVRSPAGLHLATQVPLGPGDGKFTEVSGPNVKEGMEVVIRPGAPPLDLPPPAVYPTTPAAPAVNSAAELKALQDQWKVVRIEKGKDAKAAWGKICGFGSDVDPGGVSRFDFMKAWDLVGKEMFAIKSFDPNFAFFRAAGWPGCICYFVYQIDPSASPKTIDLRGCSYEAEPTGETAALGIYEIQGDRLTIRLTPYMSTVVNNRRPGNFTLEPESGDIVFHFERYRPSKDEKAFEGEWKIASQIDDGKTVATENLRHKSYNFRDHMLTISEKKDDGKYSGFSELYFLNESKTPKTISFQTQRYVDDKGNREKLEGIYQFDGDRLQIAFCTGNTAPKSFQSAPGSGVTLLILEREKPAAGPSSQPQALGDQKMNPAEEFLKSMALVHSFTKTSSLAEAVRDFNAQMATDSVGKDQPPLTEEAVVAAIRWALSDPSKLPVSEKTLAGLKNIIESRKLPEGFELEVITTFQPNNDIVVTNWSVRLRIPREPNGTTCIMICDKMIGSRQIGPEEKKVIEKWNKKWEKQGGIAGFDRPEYEKERAEAEKVDRAKKKSNPPSEEKKSK